VPLSKYLLDHIKQTAFTGYEDQHRKYNPNFVPCQAIGLEKIPPKKEKKKKKAKMDQKSMKCVQMMGFPVSVIYSFLFPQVLSSLGVQDRQSRTWAGDHADN
jgi:hypothetical protein